MICADGRLLVLSEDGALALVEARPDRFNLKAKIEMVHGGRCWALPALANGRLYLRGESEIVCLDLRK